MLPVSGSNLRKYASYLGLGTQLSASMLLPVLLGWWIDKTYNTLPIFILVGAILGMGLLVSTLIKLVSESKQSEVTRKKFHK